MEKQPSQSQPVKPSINPPPPPLPPKDEPIVAASSGSTTMMNTENQLIIINASGHRQELDRNFRLVNIAGLGITSGNTWIALGGSIVVAIYNGGPPGVIYELIVVSVFYWFIAASIAELASAMPSSGGVYHWASVTAGKHGRITGFFAGWWNFLAWIFGVASTAQIVGAQTVSMYALFHPSPDFTPQRWQVFVAYLACTWSCCLIVLFANRALPAIEAIGGFLVIAGVFVTILVCAILPHVRGSGGGGYAGDAFVWREWRNETGYGSQGFVFCLGMLNGAFAVGTPDVISHLAEEVPQPSRNLPKAILAQFTIGFLTAFLYLIAIFYSITDLDAILNSTYLFPLTSIYLQSTSSSGGALGLLILAFLPSLIAVIGCYLTASRVLWTLARDDATPFPEFLSHVKKGKRYRNPFNAIVTCGVLCTILGCIYVGSSTAFSAFVGSFVVLSTLSYLAAILPHLLSRRRNITPGWFWMGGSSGFIVNAVSCAYIVVFIVVFCFPFALPVDAESMNYTSLITGVLTLFIGVFWFVRRGEYVGPHFVPLEEVVARDAV